MSIDEFKVKARKWRVEVYNSGSLFTFIDVIAETADEAEKQAEKQMKNPLTFKVKKI